MNIVGAVTGPGWGRYVLYAIIGIVAIILLVKLIFWISQSSSVKKKNKEEREAEKLNKSASYGSKIAEEYRNKELIQRAGKEAAEHFIHNMILAEDRDRNKTDVRFTLNIGVNMQSIEYYDSARWDSCLSVKNNPELYRDFSHDFFTNHRKEINYVSEGYESVQDGIKRMHLAYTIATLVEEYVGNAIRQGMFPDDQNSKVYLDTLYLGNPSRIEVIYTAVNMNYVPPKKI